MIQGLSIRKPFIANLLAVFLIFGLLPTRYTSQIWPKKRAIQAAAQPRRANIPFFENSVDWAQSAIFWFGINEQGVPGKNYADVRIAYTATALEIRVTVVDYYLWYNTNPNITDDLRQYEAVVIYLDTIHDRALVPNTDDFQFLLGARHWQVVESYQREARGNGYDWDDTWSGPWNGWGGMSWNCDPGPNSNTCGIDFGWTAGYVIPWETLGLSGPPDEDTLWGLGVLLYDRDEDLPAGAVDPQFWPETFQSNSPATWGEIHFGDANYSLSTNMPPTGSTVIRAASVTDNTVEDAWMGGGGWCIGGHEGGSEINYGDHPNLFIGSETAPTHFPCFNKSFLRFQLDDIPPEVGTIISATLTLHLFGNANQAIAPPFSWIHLYTISDDWDEMGIYWNNAPLAQENISAIRVYPYSKPTLDWPGDPYTWDVTQAVTTAYSSGRPVNLALYSSDSGRDTSKYFSSSETGDWNEEARPTLKVTWGIPTVYKTGSTIIATKDDSITYRLTWDGNDQNLSLTDRLPSGLSNPSDLTVSSGSVSYDENSREIRWSGAPSRGETVNLSYQTTVLVDGPQLLTNTARISNEYGLLSSDNHNLFVDYTLTYLPVISR